MLRILKLIHKLKPLDCILYSRNNICWKPTGNSIINRDVFDYIKTGVVPSLRKEDFFIDGKNYSKLIENAEFVKAYQAEVKSLSQQINTAVKDGDYSSLARVTQTCKGLVYC